MLHTIRRSFSAKLPCYSVEPIGSYDIFINLSKRFYDIDVGLCVALIPKTFPSLHCLRLHNVPDLDPFFETCASLVSLRILDISFCESVLGESNSTSQREEEFAASQDTILENTPPLEVLRIAVSFYPSRRHHYTSNSSGEKVILQMTSLIRTVSPTLIEFSVTGFSNLFFDTLKLNSMSFPVLKRLGLRSL